MSANWIHRFWVERGLFALSRIISNRAMIHMPRMVFRMYRNVTWYKPNRSITPVPIITMYMTRRIMCRTFVFFPLCCKNTIAKKRIRAITQPVICVCIISNSSKFKL